MSNTHFEKKIINFVTESGLCFQIGDEQKTQKDFIFFKKIFYSEATIHVFVRCELIMNGDMNNI